jgi:GT2 family glycosyltransferase
VSTDNPKVSVIVPTHNRCASLHRTLKALSLQTYPVPDFEVVVVADGCTDGTAEVLKNYKTPFVLRILQQSGQGAAAARNYGARRALGSLLLFLDDDVEPKPSLIETHVQAHAAQPRHAVMGPCFPVRHRQADFLRIGMRLWWHKKFETMQQAGHRYTFEDLLSGNLSIAADLFGNMGGFDPTLRGAREDYEFGVRLIKAGVPFTFASQALAYHHEYETMNLARSFQRTRQEGRGDVHIGRCHPELRPILGLAHFGEVHSLKILIVYALVFNHPKIGDGLASLLFHALTPLERIRFRAVWDRLSGRLRQYWYLRGVAEEIGSRNALIKFLQGGPAHADPGGLEIEIDLSEGVDAAERRLDHERPAGLRIRYRNHIVGRIPPRAGAESLRGAHLRPLLARTELAWLLMRALTVEAAMTQRPIPMNCSQELHREYREV